MRLLIATANPGKLAEIRTLLTGLPLEIETLAAVPDLRPPAETGMSFADNAARKALYYADATGLAAVADDSGLEIDALDGAPGVYSSRFDGDTYAEKFRRIYQLLDERGGRASPARFVCAVALARPGTLLFTAQGAVEGRIAPAPRGAGGFGYDPIFFYPPCNQTLAEMAPEAKQAVSHRGQAFRALRAYLAGAGWR